MRSLCIIPIVHTAADLGKLAPSVRSQMTSDQWTRKQSAVERLWARIRDWTNHLDPSTKTIRLYQDGLPVAPNHEHQIIADLASQGSLNHRILLALVERGASIIGTEDPNLLIAEYQRAKHEADHEESDLLNKRDRFIAERIDETLHEGDLGVLFIGLLHDVKTHLSRDIDVTSPIAIDVDSAART